VPFLIQKLKRFHRSELLLRGSLVSSMHMNLVRWKRFSWDLLKAPPPGASELRSFHIRAAAREDERALRDVIFNAFALDYGWGEIGKAIRSQLELQLDAAFSRLPIPAVVARHGQRIIAGSLLCPELDADNHLLSGPCVLAEYRNRGIGTALLLESLSMLHAAGVTRVFGVCKDASPVAKFVYRKFTSSNEAFDFEPSSDSKLSAALR
jgi:predicted N-acetyltransferase YhbS